MYDPRLRDATHEEGRTSSESAAEFLMEIVEQAPLAVHIFSGDGISLLSNERWDELWDIPENVSSEGQSIFEDESVRAAGLLPYVTLALEGQSVVTEPLHYEPARLGKGGPAKWLRGLAFPAFDDEGEVRRVTLMLEDVTENKRLEQSLTHRAYHDQLTGLPNRTLLMDRLDHALVRTERGDRTLAVVFIDLDNFKYVNDSLGHAAGDELLCGVARRLQKGTKGGDTVARIGGDEFVLLIEDIEDRADVGQIVERVIANLGGAFELRGREVYVTASVGIVAGDAGSNASANTNADTMLKHADIAMYRAKESGKDGFVIFEENMEVQPSLRLAIESDIRRALENDELVMYCQPQVDARTGDIVGVETLIRWLSPEQGIVAPGKFIPIAEETDLIIEIGEMVLAKSCAIAARMQGLTPEKPPTVWLNVSARQLGSKGFVESVRNAVSGAGIEPGMLGIEVTESVAMDHIGMSIDHTVEVLSELKDFGVQIAIDDFGTGYSSLSYLKRIPAGMLKIDRTFISGLGYSQEDEAICEAVCSLGAAMDMRVLAEGVENSTQLEAVRSLGCDAVQGYLFDRPLPHDEFLARLVSGDPYALPPR